MKRTALITAGFITAFAAAPSFALGTVDFPPSDFPAEGAFTTVSKDTVVTPRLNTDTPSKTVSAPKVSRDR